MLNLLLASILSITALAIIHYFQILKEEDSQVAVKQEKYLATPVLRRKAAQASEQQFFFDLNQEPVLNKTTLKLFPQAETSSKASCPIYNLKGERVA